MTQAEQYLAALALGAATVHEAFERQGDLPAAIRPVGRSRVCGPALTVSTLPGNNLLIHRALAQARPGDVLVVAMSALIEDGHEYGYWGDILTTAAQEKRIAGLIIDGCVRDIEAIEASGFPVFCRGTAIRGTTKAPEGEVGGAVRIGRVAIRPDDLVLGDADGVVAIPADRIARTLDLAAQREAKEARVLEELRRGKGTLEIYGFE